MDSPGRYALITGASSGIGWQLSRALANRGYHILAVSNQPSGLVDLKKQLEQACNVSVLTLDMDLAKGDSAKIVHEFCVDRQLEVEVLVNCAGFLIYGEMLKAEPGQVQSILQLHVATPALMCRLFSDEMRARGKGFILNVASIAAVMPYPTISLYGPTKSFMRHFSRALRTELKPLGIRVTCLLPGATDTGLYQRINFSLSGLKKLGVVKSPAKVADKGVEALFRNRPECIPGLLNKAAVLLLPVLPHFLIDLVYSRLRRSRKVYN